MKRHCTSLIAAALIAVVSACTASVKVHGGAPLPPGQMKKVTGSQSAKPYAPGQQKKKK